MNTRLSFVAGCAALAAIESLSLGGCAAGIPSGAMTATAGSGAVPDVSEAPLLVAPEDFDGHNYHGGGGARDHFGERQGTAVGAGRGMGAGAGAGGGAGAMGKGR